VGARREWKASGEWEPGGEWELAEQRIDNIRDVLASFSPEIEEAVSPVPTTAATTAGEYTTTCGVALTRSSMRCSTRD